MTNFSTHAKRAGLALSVLLASSNTSATSPADLYDVYSSVYSATAAEIFWPIEPIQTATYSVYRNGEQIREFTTGLSHYDGDLSPNSTYLYCVYSIVDNNVLSTGQTTLTTADDGSGRVPNDHLGACPSNPIKPGASPLTSKVYSTTAAEIFWGRDTNLNATYNLFRDGFLIAKNTTSTSYFEAGLKPNSKYTYCLYDVVDNVVTDREAITVTTLDNGTGSNPTPAAGTCPSDPLGSGLGGGQPVEPPESVGLIALSGAVYSSTALEIFWERQNIEGVTYNLFINGELVQSDIDANSYYQTDLEPGTSYMYGITATRGRDTLSSSGIELMTFEQ